MRFHPALLFMTAALAMLSIAAVPQASHSSEDAIPLTRLVLRDREVAISTKEGITQYDVFTTSGQLLRSGLTSEQLQASYPNLYDGLRPAIAREARASSADASADLLMMRLDSPITLD